RLQPGGSPAPDTLTETLPKLDLTGEYNVEFNYETKAIKFTDAAGVSTIAVDDNAAKVYYNLQGQLVENPTSGLYIVRQGNTVRKVIL
ncbi:MAG: hypothetical protein LUC85_09620, partial [Bacteroidales bacterium]|nr:hypothetical protein [Bacteroidales bacterium]